MKTVIDKMTIVGNFFEIRLNSVPADRPLPFDIFLIVNSKPVLFRRKGDVLTNDRMKNLIAHGGEKFLVPDEQRSLYLKTLSDMIRDPDSSTELRSKFIKESAFLHVHDLFTKEHVAPVVDEARLLVEEMVTFVSTDVNAVANLLRLSVHDYYTYNHCVDVAVYAIVLAKKIYGEDQQLLIRAGLGGLLHDIGKRRIDWQIINKNGPLTPTEWEEIKRHPVYGRDYLEEIPAISKESKAIVYEHHENFDGTGYPNKKKGDDIHKLARVVAIADVFDALTTDRSYHKAVTPNEALNTMFGMQPGKFDPNLFRSFNKNFDKKTDLRLPEDFDPCQHNDISKILKKAK